jgi:MFS family permease
MVSNSVSSGMNDRDSPDQLSQEDLRLGRKAAKYTRILCIIGSVFCIAIAVFVFMNVPWDTRLPYDGKYNRSGSGIPMQIAMIPAVLVLVSFWFSGRKPDAHEMNKTSRVVAYIMSTAIFLGCVIGQGVLAHGVLLAGGFLSRVDHSDTQSLIFDRSLTPMEDVALLVAPMLKLIS